MQTKLYYDYFGVNPRHGLSPSRWHGRVFVYTGRGSEIAPVWISDADYGTDKEALDACAEWLNDHSLDAVLA